MSSPWIWFLPWESASFHRAEKRRRKRTAPCKPPSGQGCSHSCRLCSWPKLITQKSSNILWFVSPFQPSETHQLKVSNLYYIYYIYDYYMCIHRVWHIMYSINVFLVNLSSSKKPGLRPTAELECAFHGASTTKCSDRTSAPPGLEESPLNGWNLGKTWWETLRNYG